VTGKYLREGSGTSILDQTPAMLALLAWHGGGSHHSDSVQGTESLNKKAVIDFTL
jgi:hypothetical protein